MEVLLDIRRMMRYKTARTVLMDITLMLKYRTVFGVDRTVGVYAFSFLFYRIFGKTEIGAGAEVAVEFLHIVALGICCVELTKIRLVLHHILKPEILDDLLLGETLGRELVCQDTVFVSMCLKPLCVGHKRGFLLTQVRPADRVSFGVKDGWGSAHAKLIGKFLVLSDLLGEEITDLLAHGKSFKNFCLRLPYPRSLWPWPSGLFVSSRGRTSERHFYDWTAA
jgi:hypothetical protein